jgi:hypothetical protein
VNKFALRFLLLTLMVSLAPPWTRYGFGAEAPEIVLRRVPPGWTTEEEGYFLNAEALSNLTAAAKTYRLERDAWEKAYRELNERSEAYASYMRRSLSDLETQIQKERDSWKSSLRKARGPGIGIFGGVGYTGSGFEPVIGVGVVWRVL